MHERRRGRLRKAKFQLLIKTNTPKGQELREQRRAARDPTIDYFIGVSKNAPVSLSQFAGEFSTDPACLVSRSDFKGGVAAHELIHSALCPKSQATPYPAVPSRV